MLKIATYSNTFGSPMPARQWSNPNSQYKFGFNCKEKDNEINVDGGNYDFGARIYDSRLGRFLSLDPKMQIYPFLSPYLFAANAVTTHIDINGMEPRDRVKSANTHVGKAYKQEEGSLRTGTDVSMPKNC